ncbi:hypothetical protein BCT71_09565 [Vibrio sp. 10N.261.51.A7]|nr:hypothetical protein BCT71_09565 [Vibrio sp. 10N.261.51.A7]
MNLAFKIERIEVYFSYLMLTNSTMSLPNLVENRNNLEKNRIYLRKKAFFCWRKVRFLCDLEALSSHICLMKAILCKKERKTIAQ